MGEWGAILGVEYIAAAINYTGGIQFRQWCALFTHQVPKHDVQVGPPLYSTPVHFEPICRLRMGRREQAQQQKGCSNKQRSRHSGVADDRQAPVIKVGQQQRR
jgi:hypothetical protein